jgi:hypothetical protein
VSKKDDGVVNIHGKQYLTVARRTNDFRERHPDYGIHTEILSIDDATVVCRAVITDEAGRQLSSGIAEESRTSSRINQTSAVENCETSAVGRALAFFGMAGTEIASADEVAGAINAQAEIEAGAHLKAHLDVVHKYFDEVSAIKTGIAEGDYMTAGGHWFDLHEKAAVPELEALKLARTKGGIWSTAESKQLQPHGEVSKVANKMRKESAA